MENNCGIGTILFQQDDKGRILTNNIAEVTGKPGVWALYGRADDSVDNSFCCLNVGKEKNIGKEILYDVSCLNFLPFRDNGEEKYINQFAEYCGFSSTTNMTQEYLYPYISSHFSYPTFIMIYDSNDEEYEKLFAWQMHAKFWRGGGSFKKEKNDYYAQNYREVLRPIGNFNLQSVSNTDKLKEIVMDFYRKYKNHK